MSQKTKIDGMQSIRNSFRQRGFSEQATNIFMSSWKWGTKRKYNTFILRWFEYCYKRKIASISPSLKEVIEFLTEQYNNGLGYDSLNTTRSALSSLGLNFEGFKIGSHPLVVRYLKGVFIIRPPKPRYTHIKDVNKVLIFLRKLSPVKHISLKDLTFKTTMLMALAQAARVQILNVITLKDVKKTKNFFYLN
jgi:hypothetical protein